MAPANSALSIVLLSGPVAVGKTTVTGALVNRFGFERIRSGAFLLAKAAELQIPHDRAGLQSLGDRLDDETDYRWLVDDVARPALAAKSQHRRWLIDAVRKAKQVEHFRDAFGGAILHVHLTADEPVLRARYDARLTSGDEYVGATPYDQAILHPNEIASRGLQDIADLVIHVEGKSTNEIAAEVVGAMKYPE